MQKTIQIGRKLFLQLIQHFLQITQLKSGLIGAIIKLMQYSGQLIGILRHLRHIPDIIIQFRRLFYLRMSPVTCQIRILNLRLP